MHFKPSIYKALAHIRICLCVKTYLNGLLKRYLHLSPHSVIKFSAVNTIVITNPVVWVEEILIMGKRSRGFHNDF
jgi:hypothetical protein